MKKVISTLLILASLNPVYSIECTDELTETFDQFPEWLSEDYAGVAFDESCIRYSMNAFAGWAQSLGYPENGKKGVFVYCSEDSFRRSSIPQCQTKSYINATLNSYSKVTSCLGINPDELFPIVASESGFYHNAYSPSGKDFGMGQVTDPAIHDVNSNWDRYVDEIKNSDKESCQKLIELIEVKDLAPVESDFHCTLTQAPANPLLNALYTGMHYRNVQSYTVGWAERVNLRGRIETYLGQNFTDRRYKNILAVLNMLSYNLGFNAMIMTFEEYLKEKEYYLGTLLDQRREISRELAETNFALMEMVTEDLKSKKKEILERLNKVEIDINYLRDPSRFDGDYKTDHSFGKYLVDREISFYLRLLQNRMEYIARKDKRGLCPAQKVIHIK